MTSAILLGVAERLIRCGEGVGEEVDGDGEAVELRKERYGASHLQSGSKEKPATPRLSSSTSITESAPVPLTSTPSLVGEGEGGTTDFDFNDLAIDPVTLLDLVSTPGYEMNTLAATIQNPKDAMEGGMDWHSDLLMREL